MSENDKKSVSTQQTTTPEKQSHYTSPFDEMEKMMSHFFDRGWPSPFHFPRSMWPDFKPPFEGRTPKVDIINRDKEIIVKAELPGVKREDLDVTVTDDTLTIKASTKHEEEKEDGEYHRKELSTGSFLRSIQLPSNVDASKTVATFKDGLLKLTLPKMVEAKRHSIPID